MSLTETKRTVLCDVSLSCQHSDYMADFWARVCDVSLSCHQSDNMADFWARACDVSLKFCRSQCGQLSSASV
jgi:hypothetical protein